MRGARVAVVAAVLGLVGCSSALREQATLALQVRREGDALTEQLERRYEAQQLACIEAACGERRPCPEARACVQCVREAWAPLQQAHGRLVAAHERLVGAVLRAAAGGPKPEQETVDAVREGLKRLDQLAPQVEQGAEACVGR